MYFLLPHYNNYKMGR